MSTAAPVPELLRGLVDDAAIFPPGNASLDAAVRAHHEHLTTPYADLVGPFVVDDRRLADLRVVREESTPPNPSEGRERHGLPVSVVVTGGAGAIEPAVAWAAKGELRLLGLEAAIRESDAGDLAPNVRRIVAAVDAVVASGDLDDDVAVYVETPRLYGVAATGPSPTWLRALDELAAAGHSLKLRTGGLEADAFPSAIELATCIGAALDRELPFKCTAGLHNALRHRDDETGFEHHGFLNVLVATRASLDGAEAGEVAAVLEETDADKLLARSDENGLARARRWFRSFGSCSIDEPLTDLRRLGLMAS